MTPAELAQHDAADRLRILDAAIADNRRGRTVRAAQSASTAAIDAGHARLLAERETAQRRLDELTTPARRAA